ncbi:MAG: BatD family protein [Candidatus Babeliales bacterium]
MLGKDNKYGIVRFISVLSFFLISCGSVFFSHSTSLVINVKDEQGFAIKDNTMLVGTPFIIELVIEDARSSVGRNQVIPGLDMFSVRGRSQEWQLINGKRRLLIRYIVISEKVGTYSIGPVEIMQGQDRYQSEMIHLTIIQQSKDDRGQVQTIKEHEPYMFLETSKDLIFVGEKATITLGYCPAVNVEFNEVSYPDLSMFPSTFKGGPFSTTKYIGGISRRCICWQWDIYPKKAGKYTIKGGKVSVLVNDNPMLKHGLGVFFSLLQSHSQKIISSTDLILDVKSLPSTNKEVHGVGAFTESSSTVFPETVQQGEALEFTWNVLGKKGAWIFKDPVLNMGDKGEDFIVYSTHKHESSCEEEMEQYSFTFIIQPLKEGAWEIPSQQFSFFDPEKENYEQLITDPHLITVTSRPVVETSKEVTKESAISTFDKEVEDFLLTIDTIDDRDGRHGRALPLRFFILLNIALVGIAIGGRIYCSYQKNKVQRAKKIIRTARTRFMQSENNGQYDHLYSIIMSCVKDLSHIGYTIDVICEQDIEVKVQWKLFMEKVAQVRFGGAKVVKDSRLFQEAYQWLLIFEDIV